MNLSRFYVSGIKTAEQNRQLYDITKDFFEGATILPAIGIWMNEIEASYLIEVVDTRGDLTIEKKKEYAHCLATQFDQDAVMLVEMPVKAMFLGPHEPAGDKTIHDVKPTVFTD